MILATIGAVLIIAGVLVVVRKTAETWAQRRAGIPAEANERTAIPHYAIALIGVGAILVAIATS